MSPETHVEALQEMNRIMEILLGDVDAARGTPPEDTPEKRRRFIRNGIAMVEGVTAGIQRVCLADAKAGGTRFTVGQIAILRGRSYEVTDEGDVRPRPQKHRLMAMVRFSFQAYARVYDVPFTLDVRDTGWSCLRKTVRVRNRLLHPRSAADLEVMDPELKDARSAFKWFATQNQKFANLVLAALGPDLEEARKHSEPEPAPRDSISS